MLLNLIIAGIVGCLLLVLYAIKGIFDCINTLDQTVRKLAKITDLLHDRLLHVERLINDQVEAKKNTAKNE